MYFDWRINRVSKEPNTFDFQFLGNKSFGYDVEYDVGILDRSVRWLIFQKP